MWLKLKDRIFSFLEKSLLEPSKLYLMKFIFILWIFLSAFCLGLQGQNDLPINETFEDVPENLATEVLLIPRYDIMDLKNLPDGLSPAVASKFNREAERANSYIRAIAQKHYPTKFVLVSLSDIDSLREEGYRYFMDMVLMPKQLRAPEPKAMIPSYDKYGATHKMFNNRYTQFHYYFYIRDLESDDAYLTSKFRGERDVYQGIKRFLKQLEKDMVE